MQGFKKELLVFNVNQITFGVKLSCKCREKKKYKPYHPRRLIRICFFYQKVELERHIRSF